MQHTIAEKSDASGVFKLALLQVVVSLIVSLAVYFWLSRDAAVSALLGGLICAAANLFFAGRLFVSAPDLSAESIVRRFYRSESLKILFTLTMFFICIAIVKVPILPFIIMYLIAAVLLNWLFLLFA